MSGGLFALFDDVAALVKLTASSIDDVAGAAGRASAKAAGVVVDDTAVTPRYVQSLSPARELPIIKRIAYGSLRNKLLIILPAILLLSQLLPALLTPLLMIGGAYLCYEGAEKVWEWVTHRDGGTDAHGGSTGAASSAAGTTAGDVRVADADLERSTVAGAIRTDFILSAEIMVIALNEVAEEPLLSRALILVVVAVAITLLVYGVVGLIVKMDDVGLHLAQRRAAAAQRTGRLLVAAMPRLLAALSVIGVVAMLWVGGHILLNGVHELGWDWPYDVVHHLQERVADAVPRVGGALGWVAATAMSAVIGLLVGAVLVAVLHLVPRRRRSAASAH